MHEPEKAMASVYRIVSSETVGCSGYELIRIQFTIDFAKKKVVGGWTAMCPYCGTEVC